MKIRKKIIQLLLLLFLGLYLQSCTVEEIIIPSDQKPYFSINGMIDGNNVLFQAGIDGYVNSSEVYNFVDSLSIDSIYVYSSTFSNDCSTPMCDERLSFHFYTVDKIVTENDALQTFSPKQVGPTDLLNPFFNDLYIVNHSNEDLMVIVDINAIDYPLVLGEPLLVGDLFFPLFMYNISRPDLYELDLYIDPICIEPGFHQNKIINPINIKSIDDHMIEISINQNNVNIESIHWSDGFGAIDRIIDLRTIESVSLDYIDLYGCIGMLDISFLSETISNPFEDDISIELYTEPYDLKVGLLYVDEGGYLYESCGCVELLDLYILESKPFSEQYEGRDVIELEVAFSGELISLDNGDIKLLEGFTGKIAISY